MSEDDKRLEWFNGNRDALAVYKTFIHLLHTWDDLVDKDKDVSEGDVNEAFLSALVYLPANPFYASIQRDILPMWMGVVSAYEAANKYEREGDEHGLEIGHTLRYAAGHIAAHMILVCCGREKAKEYIPAMWKSVVYERFDEYKKEHTK